MNPRVAALSAALLTCLTSSRWAAADWQTSGGLVVTHQTSRADHVDQETEASTDLIFSRPAGAAEWLVHFEATTTPDSLGVSGILPEANSDVGSALDKDNKGRVQLSELYYRYAFIPGRSLTAGLVDVSGFFEQSRIASDESTQFLGASFTGNPTIEFPDYTLGLIYEQALDSGPVARAAVTGSNGLADNTERSYSQLLSVEDDDKGLFAITSLSWKTETRLLRLGAWANTANHNAIDGSGRDLDNYGAYLLAGHRQNRHAINLRLGLAREKVSRASGFAGLGYQFAQGVHVLGAGAARAFLSPREPDPTLGDMRHYEIYWRYALARGFFLTGDFQRIDNSNFGELSANRNRAINVYGVRLSYLFE